MPLGLAEAEGAVGAFLDRFRKQPDPKELVRKWQSDLRTEQRRLDSEIRAIEREKKKAEQQCKENAKRGDMASAKTLAKEIVRTKKAVSRMHISKANLVAMNSQLVEQLATVRLAGTLAQSTKVMTLCNDMMKLPQLQQTAQQMSKEMMKAGLINEMVGDAIDSATEVEGEEEEAEEEVEKVLMEVAGDTIAKLNSSSVPASRRRASQEVQQGAAQEGGLAAQQPLRS